MPAVARKGDPATEHPCGGQSNPMVASSDVFAEGIAVHRLGDTNVPHAFYSPPHCVPHTTPLATASSTVFINGKGCARVGDSYSCGTIITGGAGTVFAG